MIVTVGVGVIVTVGVGVIVAVGVGVEEKLGVTSPLLAIRAPVADVAVPFSIFVQLI